MADLDRVIYEQLCVGKVSDEAQRTVRQIVARLAKDGARQALLACTELNLLIDTASLDGVRIIDAARVHIQALADASVGNESKDGAS
jgi:aspartate racemase